MRPVFLKLCRQLCAPPWVLGSGNGLLTPGVSTPQAGAAHLHHTGRPGALAGGGDGCEPKQLYIVLPCVSAPSGCASQQLSIIDCEYAGLIDPAIWVAEALVHMCWLDWGICTESEFPFSADHCAWHCEQYVALRSERGDPVDANFLQRVHLLRDALIVKFLLLKIMLYCTNMGSSGPSDTRDKHAAAAERDAGVAPGQMGRGELPGGSTDQLRKTLTVYYHMACAIET